MNCNLVDVGVQEYEECEPVGHDEEGVPGQEPEKGLHNLHQIYNISENEYRAKVKFSSSIHLDIKHALYTNNEL